MQQPEARGPLATVRRAIGPVPEWPDRTPAPVALVWLALALGAVVAGVLWYADAAPLTGAEVLQFELAGSAADARELPADGDLVVESLEADLPLILGYVVGLFALCLLGRRVFRSRRARRLSNVAAWAVLVAAALDVLENRALASALDAEGYASDAWLWASVSTVVKFALLLVVGLVATSVVVVVLARLAAPRIRYALRPAELPPTPGGLGICASGGGIRSACTTLGVLQVLRERGWLAKAEHLVSVSGGGYMTGAMQLAAQPPGGWEERLGEVRGTSSAIDAAADEVHRVLALPPGEEQAAQLERARQAVDRARAGVEGLGERAWAELREAVQTLEDVVQSVPVDGAFAPRSPEFEHVRRHGRYIADSPKEWAVAAVVVLRGVVVSLALIAGTVTTLGLLLGGLYRLVPLADLTEVAVADPDLGAAVRTGGVVAPLLILAVGVLAWAVQLVLLGWVSSISVPVMRFLRTVAVAATWSAVGIAVLTVGVPVLVWSYEQAAFLRERIGSPGAGLGTVLTTYVGALVAILSRHRSTLETAGKTGGRLRSWLNRGANPTQESSGGLIQRAVVLVVLTLLVLVLASLFAAVVAVTVPDAVVTTDDGPNAWRLYPQTDELAPVLLALTALLLVALALVWWSESRQRSDGERGRRSTAVVCTALAVLGAVAVGAAAVIPYRDEWSLIAGRLNDDVPMWPAWWCLVVPLVFAFVSLTIDQTWMSMHPFYRRRLATAFAVRRHGEEAREYDFERETTTLPDYGRRVPGMPRLVFAAAANLSGQDKTPPGRKATSFTFSSDVIGGSKVGYVRTRDLQGLVAGPVLSDLTLQSAVAVSGAAFASAMGRQARPAQILLALSNARLGTWLPNPEWLMECGRQGEVLPDWQLPRVPRVRRVTYLLREVLGRFSSDDRLLYVTDGGHYENLGLVELLRRGPSTVVCIDAGGDKPPATSDIAEAMTLARQELGIEIALDAPWMLTPGGGATLTPESPLAGLSERLSQASVVAGTIRYPSDPAYPAQVGRLVVVKLRLTAQMPYDLLTYAMTHGSFPYDSTGDQWFDEGQFDAFHGLGRHLGGEVAAVLGDAAGGTGTAGERPLDPPPSAGAGESGLSAAARTGMPRALWSALVRLFRALRGSSDPPPG